MQENHNNQEKTIIIKEYALSESDKKWLKSNCGKQERFFLYAMVLFIAIYCALHTSVEKSDKEFIWKDGERILLRIENTKGTNVVENTN